MSVDPTAAVRPPPRPPRQVGMTSSGKQLTALIAIALAGFIPKHVECGFPGNECLRYGRAKLVCRDYEVEPIAFFLLERFFERDIGFAYSTGETCR